MAKTNPETIICRICHERHVIGTDHKCDKRKAGVVEALKAWSNRTDG